MPDVSIAISAKDNFSSTLKTIANNTRNSVKSIDDLQTSLTKLNNTKVNVQTNLDKVKDELKEAKKNFLEFGDAASEAAYKTKQEEFNNLSSSLRAVNREAKAAERSMQDLAGTNSKIMNRADTTGSLGGESASYDGGTDLLGSLAKAGLGKMLASSIQGATNTMISSALGDTAGSAVSSMLGGALEGAVIGSVVPGIGTAAGAIVGLVSGGITAATQAFEKEDDAFKSYVQEKVEGALQEQQDTLTSGSSISGGREQTMIAFEQLFGSAEAATDYLEQVRDLANRTNYAYDDITGYTQRMLVSFDKDDVLDNLLTLSDATAALNWNGADVDQIVDVMNQMRITDKITAMQANQFANRNLDIYQALADGKDVDRSKIKQMITDGDIGGTEATQYILDYINSNYGGLSDKQALSFEGLLDNLQDTEADLQAAMGAGYNEARKEGLQKQIDFNTGEAGASLEEAYTLMGEFQADLENTREQMQRDAMTAVMQGIMPEESFDNEQIRERLQNMAQEYQQALADSTDPTLGMEEQQQARADMGRLLAEAKVLAESEYNASEGAQIVIDSQYQLAGQVAENTAADSLYYDAGYRLGQQYTKGITSAILSYTPPTVEVPQIGVAGSSTSNSAGYSGFGTYAYGAGVSRAMGENRVPYDGFPAILHEGERVLTAQQARQQDAGSGGAGAPIININLTGATVRQDSDIPALANAVAAEFLKAWDIAR